MCGVNEGEKNGKIRRAIRLEFQKMVMIIRLSVFSSTFIYYTCIRIRNDVSKGRGITRSRWRRMDKGEIFSAMGFFRQVSYSIRLLVPMPGPGRMVGKELMRFKTRNKRVQPN